MSFSKGGANLYEISTEEQTFSVFNAAEQGLSIINCVWWASIICPTFIYFSGSWNFVNSKSKTLLQF